MPKEVSIHMPVLFYVSNVFTINIWKISLKTNFVNTGFAARMSLAGALQHCASATLVFSIFLPERWSDPGTFSKTSNGSVNRPYQLF